ncbi:MAG: hypothetical protein A3H69_05765 [Candidatus Sungbacteria bacterium RIFCSPLOWO2_02_FULL_47_9]|uniref:Elongation factor P n=1 Tax=Candidatus Sungbacteria bacterium RIFCSPHIGHO2_01_FULL_47_32 TaxID=1802264 RepID=A0A1G2K8N7_9BACT|nr:MAG: hypothetical protein A2633_00640 [Candidatus Sungbacteria bacterium RIFCSPHIGHO2_01_FULL_47_32]OHA04593.1 MAG: hypothetical protein A3A28_01385 [Candidatus Sungbacteria bacterium RIFCSPLOWO2_01_FULL_47_32]OHA10137.1 MAG: hypothetical protein A3H69_05765 [Candidatus Sungbacteria bacterium RIFCSPLOWO2_02_FULL_47_9]
MLSMNDLKNGSIFLMDGSLLEALDVKHLHMGRGGSSVQTRLKNLITGQVVSRNFKQSDSFQEADIEKKKIKFLYSHRGEHVFVDPANPSQRFPLEEERVGNIVRWLKPNTECEAVVYEEKILSIKPPIKIELKVTEAPPGVKGDRAQSGTKIVTLESGATLDVPLFIEEGDIVRVNTEIGEYTERVEKA